MARPSRGKAPQARDVLGAVFAVLALSLSIPSEAQTPQPESQTATEPASGSAPQPIAHPASRAPAHIHWQLAVLMDGQQVDSFTGDTAVGQSQTATHHHPVSHSVGCEGAQTVPTDLSRTISVSPLGVDSNQIIGFEISADDVIEDNGGRAVLGTGCALPPHTRTISARHPELDVPSGKSNDWILLKHQPQLIYRLEASVASIK